MRSLDQIADMLDAAPRYGGTRENRGGKAVASLDGQTHHTDRHIRLSDAIARDIAATLRVYSSGRSKSVIPLSHRKEAIR